MRALRRIARSARRRRRSRESTRDHPRRPQGITVDPRAQPVGPDRLSLTGLLRGRRRTRVTGCDNITPFWGIHLTGAGLVSRSPWPSGRRAVQRRWLASRAGWLPWAGRGPLIEHEVAVAHWLVVDGELEDAVEDQAAAA